MEIKIVTSEDGSHTLFIPSMNETYHSLHGAVQESEHVFIKEGLNKVAQEKETMNVFEVGFGTGLNALLTLKYCLEHHRKVNYFTLEPFPISEELVQGINYTSLFKDDRLTAAYKGFHQQSFDEKRSYEDIFTFRKFNQKLEIFASPVPLMDVIYYDAFAPSKQPEVWELSNIQRVYDLLVMGGSLVTYCAMGQFKRNLKAVGFEVESLPGPPGKKEMTRGLKMQDA